MKYFVAGGAGFIGSHLVKKIIKNLDAEKITVYDNFSSGQDWHLANVLNDERLKIIRADIKDLPTLTAAVKDHDQVFLFASNPDIARAQSQPDIDFWEGTYLAQNILEAMRINKVKHLIYASGSGIYGDTGLVEVSEDYAPLLPISTYGASKLACEALISSYCSMFGMTARAYRFANVVGPNQTHGVAYDFIRKLRADPAHLPILGNGKQSKSYIHVDDILEAVFLSDRLSKRQFDYFNVATGDYLTVIEIAEIVTEAMDLKDVVYQFSGGDRGWKGDVPFVRFDIQKISSLGWKASRNSKEAIQNAVQSMLAEMISPHG